MDLYRFLENHREEFIRLFSNLTTEPEKALKGRHFDKKKKLAILFPKLIQLKGTYKMLRLYQKIDLRRLYRSFDLGSVRIDKKYINTKNIDSVTLLHRPAGLVNLVNKNVYLLTEKVDLPIMRLNCGKTDLLLVKKDIHRKLVEHFGGVFSPIKVRPILFRKILEETGFKFTMIKVYVGEEVGGVEGIKYIIVSGNDVLRGEEEFFRRYKSRSVIFHKLGAVVEVEIGGSLKISIEGDLQITNFMTFLYYFDNVVGILNKFQ